MGWRILGETSDREIVVGAVTTPWEANVTFRSLDAEEFAAFNDPGYVKIVWSLRADPLGSDRSIFRTETRAVATDRDAGARFHPYWAFASAGIWLIRRASLGPLKPRRRTPRYGVVTATLTASPVSTAFSTTNSRCG